MPVFNHAAVFKFSVRARAGESHVKAINSVQGVTTEISAFASRVECNTRRIFNYLFLFGSDKQIDLVEQHINACYVAQPYRQLEMVVDLEGDEEYLSWILGAADRFRQIPISIGARPTPTVRDFFALLEKGPVGALSEATFMPTINVNSPVTGIKPRFSTGLDFTELERAISRSGDSGSELLLLDGDGIKKARAGAGRPTLFAMHSERVKTETQQRSCFVEAMMSVFESRQQLDGMFDNVIAGIVQKIVSAGFVAQYLGGDELVAVAPVNVVAAIVDAVCTEADFEIAFSCGRSQVSTFDCLEEGFLSASHDLRVAKSLSRRGVFNVAS